MPFERRRDSPVEQLLLDVVRVGADPETGLKKARHAADVQACLDEASGHGVLALLAQAALSFPDAWPAMTAAMKPVWREQTAWALRAQVDLAGLAAALVDIPYAVVKGPVLAAHAYRDPFSRWSTDVDLLVARSDRSRAALALGIEVHGFDDADLREAGEISARLPGDTPLDLHWELINDPVIRRDTHLPTASVLSRRRLVEVQGIEVSTLDRTDTLLHLASHTSVSGGHRLTWYVDLDRVIRRDGYDRDLLVSRARAARLGTTLAVQLRRAQRHLGTPLDPTLLRDLTGSHVWSAVGRGFDRISPPSGLSSRPSRGQLYNRSSRGELGASLQAFAALLPEVRGVVREVRSVGLVSLEPWDSTWRRNQHLSAQLVRRGHLHRLVFVEPPIPGRLGNSWSPEPGITVLRPALVVPKRAGGLQAAGSSLRLGALRDVDLVWVNDPELGVHCLPLTKPAIYDVTDDWRTFGQAPHVMERIISAENELARRARTIVCSSVLASRWSSRYGVTATIVRNAVDAAAFADAVPRSFDGPGPHVGYVGTLHPERLDLALVASLAAVATVHLVGPSSLSPLETGLLVSAGVVLHGPVPASDVPSWMLGLDVLLSPHVVTDFTMSLDAIKSHEYLHSGRPVLATPTSGFQALVAPQLRLASPSAFLEALRVMLADPPEGQAISESWADRADEMALILSRT